MGAYVTGRGTFAECRLGGLEGVGAAALFSGTQQVKRVRKEESQEVREEVMSLSCLWTGRSC